MINFFTEDTLYSIDFPVDEVVSWLHHIIRAYQFELNDLSVILCSDQYLLEINRAYLSHDYFTDVITFDNSDAPRTIDGDIFISVDRVNDHAKLYKVSFHSELFRVIVHGLLHLLGFGDKSQQESVIMRDLEDKYLFSLFDQFLS